MRATRGDDTRQHYDEAMCTQEKNKGGGGVDTPPNTAVHGGCLHVDERRLNSDNTLFTRGCISTTTGFGTGFDDLHRLRDGGEAAVAHTTGRID
jgi:hypothetical protein